MANTTFHMHLSVRGAILDFSKRELGSLFQNTATGRWLTADEAKGALLDHLAADRAVLLMGAPCAGHTTATQAAVKPLRRGPTLLPKEPR
ncbi:hypothetical protein [Stenotrophomonas sp. GZD-301]|uniref:hypothetical protein n=1 Tax=Stenotrophomonas sp. GZD-301 TaxID=3404814 RepID=UPI003BB7B43D